MQVQRFVTVVQRMILITDDSLLPIFGPLYSIETHLSMEERSLLASKAMNLPEKFVACEIGSYVGASACFLAAAASLKGGIVHCVDTWDNRAMGEEDPRDTHEEFLRNTEKFRSQIVIHRGHSLDLADEIPQELDLLFIDGDHSYPAVSADLAAYVPKLKPGGLLLMHDMDYPSVIQALNDQFNGRPMLDRGRAKNLQVLQVPQMLQSPAV